MRKQFAIKLLALLTALSLLCTAAAGCGAIDAAEVSAAIAAVSFAPLPDTPDAAAPDITSAPVPTAVPFPSAAVTPEIQDPQSPGDAVDPDPGDSPEFRYDELPPFTGAPYVAVNGNTPFFAPNEITAGAFERYSNFDALGRCRTAWASVGLELMPQGEREDISSVTPTGWNQAQIDGEWLYNRCHLIGYQLTGENARPQNLITGTRFLNMQGMLPFENMVADYIKETGNHVMYRATPCFVGDELVCRGVLLEGLSVEDGGDGICFCVFAYNVQPNVDINYSDGSSSVSGSAPAGAPVPEAPAPGLPAPAEPDQGAVQEPAEPAADPTPVPEQPAVAASYIGNRNTGKFHASSCSEISKMKESNKVPMSSREEAIANGYAPCKRCKP